MWSSTIYHLMGKLIGYMGGIIAESYDIYVQFAGCFRYTLQNQMVKIIVYVSSRNPKVYLFLGETGSM
jgi:hypothetical protein